MMAGMLLKNLRTSEALDEPTATWNVPLSDGNHVIEFEHGTASGRRSVRIDGEEIIHRDWMFQLVGDEVFKFNDNTFVIRIEPIPKFQYSYTLWVNGKSFKNFVQSQSKVLNTWSANVGNDEYRIVLDKQTQNVWLNGEQIETESEFTDDGAEILFSVGDLPAVIRTYSSGQKNVGITYSLYINDSEIEKETLFNEDEET